MSASRFEKRCTIYELINELAVAGGCNQDEQAMLFRMRKFLDVTDEQLGHAHLPSNPVRAVK